MVLPSPAKTKTGNGFIQGLTEHWPLICFVAAVLVLVGREMQWRESVDFVPRAELVLELSLIRSELINTNRLMERMEVLLNKSINQNRTQIEQNREQLAWIYANHHPGDFPKKLRRRGREEEGEE